MTMFISVLDALDCLSPIPAGVTVGSVRDVCTVMVTAVWTVQMHSIETEKFSPWYLCVYVPLWVYVPISHPAWFACAAFTCLHYFTILHPYSIFLDGASVYG